MDYIITHTPIKKYFSRDRAALSFDFVRHEFPTGSHDCRNLEDGLRRTTILDRIMKDRRI
jgi:hypothetical protein